MNALVLVILTITIHILSVKYLTKLKKKTFIPYSLTRTVLNLSNVTVIRIDLCSSVLKWKQNLAIDLFFPPYILGFFVSFKGKKMGGGESLIVK